MKKIAEKTFTANLTLDTSYNSRSLGNHESTMTLYLTQNNSGQIEWDIPALEITEYIGLWFDHNKLVDYDGVFGLPQEARILLTEQGYDLSEIYQEA